MREKRKKVTKIISILKDLFPTPETELTYNKPYEFLFAVIMSAQTTDKQVNKVTQKLFNNFTTLESFAEVELEILEKAISSIGLYRSKAKNIQLTAKKLINEFHGEVPSTLEELITFPGVARKTANVVLHHIYNKQEGIAVDTHVQRLSNRFGLSSHTDPKKIEQDLMKIVPQEEWGNFSLRLILYGRYYFPARAKHHDGPLAEFVVT